MNNGVFKWSKYIGHIYNIRNNTVNVENERELKKYNIIQSGIFSYSYYKVGLKWNYVKHFKEAQFINVINDAYINKYNNIMIIYDECIFSSNIYNIICEYSNKECTILNAGDINEDCIILSKSAIAFIHDLNINTNNITWVDNLKNEMNTKLSIFKPESICTHKIDYIVTYVNDTDINWQKSFEQYKSSITGTYNQSNRWQSYEYMFKLHIENVIEFMPWVNNIYLVVSESSQVPQWVDKNKIKIIYHRDIIPGILLPTFNSCTIEMFLHNINGLSEYFIYANDDTLVLNNIAKTSFYNNGKIYNKWQSFDTKTNHHIICNNSLTLIKNEINNALINNIKFKHIPHPFLLSSCKHVYTVNISKIYNSCTRFRANKNYNQYLYLYYDLVIGKVYYMNNSYKYIKLDYNTDNLNNKLNNIISQNQQYDFICINDVNIHTANIIKYINYNVNKNLKIAICAIAKNENLYIREWVEYHKKLGFTNIYIYDNNELDGEHFEDVINDYIQSGYVIIKNVRGVEKGCVYDNEGINLQSKCYIEFYENEANKYDWVLYIDIDEFISFQKNINLQNMLSADIFNKYDTILIPWDHYDDNNYLEYTNENVYKKFTRKSKIQNYHATKSFVRTGLNINNKKQINLIHIFTLKDSRIICSNGIVPKLNKKGDWYKVPENKMQLCLCVINHYKTKTLEEFILRHLGRHWGTAIEHTVKQRNYYDVLVDFYKYNWWNNNKAYFIHKDLNYNAIIALTSWKKRIDTTYLTINNLKEACGDKYKIVITLSIDEFPNKEKELPQSLLDTNIEIIWVQKNYGCYKKVLFAMNKYQNIPIISADDDCLYKYDYATELYEKWLKNPTCIITTFKENKYNIDGKGYFFSHGRATIFPPSALLRLLPYIEDEEILSRKNDDSLYGIYAKKEKIDILYLNHTYDEVLEYSTNNDSLTYELMKNKCKAQEKFLEDKKIFINKLL